MHERRYNKLKLYAHSKQKTMTQLIEDWVDRLPNVEIVQTPWQGVSTDICYIKPRQI